MNQLDGRLCRVTYSRSAFRKLLRLVHSVSDQKLLGTDTHVFPENLAEVVPVDFTGFRNSRNGDVILKILGNIAECPFQIIGTHAAAGGCGFGCG